MGCGLGFLSVALGAFGAHALKTKLSTEMMAVYQTAVQYHQVHALALLALVCLTPRLHNPTATVAGWLFVAGTIVFSGSLYLLATTGTRWLGAITPIGGLALLGGWACMLWAAFAKA